MSDFSPWIDRHDISGLCEVNLLPKVIVLEPVTGALILNAYRAEVEQMVAVHTSRYGRYLVQVDFLLLRVLLE